MKMPLPKNLIFLIIVLIIVLVIQIVYIGYFLLCNNKVSLYFDGTNAIASNGSYYVTVGSNNDNDNYYEKAKVSRYNKKREKTFEKLYNVGYNSSFFGVLLNDNGIVAVGNYEKTLNEHSKSIRRALIVKYNSDGEVEFENDLKVLDNSKFTGIAEVDDGYIVVGQSVYRNTKVGNDSGGALIVKYNKEGKLLWKKTYGNNKEGIFNDLLVIDDYIYTVGTFENYLGVLCKFDMSGNLISDTKYEFTDDVGFSGIVNIDNDIYVCGSKRENSNVTNAVIVQYDLDCDYINQVVYKSSSVTRYNKLTVDDHDNIIAIGTMIADRSTKGKVTNLFDYDGIVGKYSSSSLEKVSVVNYGDERDDFFTDIMIEKNNYLIVGYSSYEDGSYLSKFITYSDAMKNISVD